MGLKERAVPRVWPPVSLCDHLKHATKALLKQLRGCGLTEWGCSLLGLALASKPFGLRVLDLSENPLKDEGVKRLCDSLQSKHCRLKTLSLKSCGLLDLSCRYLVSALKSNLTLEELDLRDNYVTSVGVKELRDFQPGPGRRRIRIYHDVHSGEEEVYTVPSPESCSPQPG
uniref:Uncharacterized protein n=1 Tax=Neogobius melanostomus TaxID=47308 RepID=A0A8C6SYL6_9GOBI